MATGLIQVYCGEGKGKTTAAVGLAIRAQAAGLKVVFAQFLKSDKSSEIRVLRTLTNVTVLHADIPEKFSFQMSEEELAQTRKEHDVMLRKAIALSNGENSLLVLDEVIGAMEKDLVDTELVMELLHARLLQEIVLTGRNPSEKVLEIAHYVSEIKNVKHPFSNGVGAREGIEF